MKEENVHTEFNEKKRENIIVEKKKLFSNQNTENITGVILSVFRKNAKFDISECTIHTHDA